MGNQNSTNARAKGADLSIVAGLGLAVLFFIGTSLVTWLNVNTLNENTKKVMATHDATVALGELVSIAKDAETGQRSFILTGDETYLQPYIDAMAGFEAAISKTRSIPQDMLDHSRVDALEKTLRNRVAKLAAAIEVRRTQGMDAAAAMVGTNGGRADMAAARKLSEELMADIRQARAAAIEERTGAFKIALATGIVTGALGVVLSIVIGVVMLRSAAARRRLAWLQAGELGLTNALAGQQRVEQLGESVLKFFSEYIGAQVGAFFAKENGHFRRVAAYGLPAEAATPKQFEAGDSLLGQAARDRRVFFVSDIPDGYLPLGSGTGQGSPRHLVIAPAVSDMLVEAVYEIGVMDSFGPIVKELLERSAEPIAVAVRAANYRSHLQNLLEETQRQGEELQAQSEELRVSNEELEEQSRTLRESQTRLEQQQAELEQTNSQLEEQTALLESQRDDLSRAKTIVQTKAQELEQASRYKSDFLANMSHELRTPLNSSLILAKLLADNPDGNLTEEQVKYALTIQSSGNDLLTLINDILDLSKIEAGHMEIRPEPMLTNRLTDDLVRMFQPIAQQKGLDFVTRIEAGAPVNVVTDRQRLEQVLKNLLSNAFKFTEKGRVELVISRADDGRVRFAVKDTGIGISEDQQKAVFEAFRQADSTISRKYGGTGLGLSISRQLVRLLGGSITLASKPGEGSEFAILLPENYDSGLVPKEPSAELILKDVEMLDRAAPAKDEEHAPVRPAYGEGQMADDRESLDPKARLLLVIEDDAAFAKILYDLSHELNFQCLIAHTAGEALQLAKRYLPSAVILDVGLPDNSGLSVLDRLKRDAKTRHIPVHVISGSDYAQTALSMGAVGYALKPVKREELADVLKGFENRLTHRLRRVLVVEDDPVQLDAVRRLLGSQDVETVGAQTAAECLDLLKSSTFDCMVLDLTLPDATGYSLLETISKGDAYSFPPVIVYTGRDLPADEEHRLRKYSSSIIIKGAKSPERLLDEVTLFLHQVVAKLPAEQQKMLQKARNRDAVLEGRRILVVEDDVRNVYAVTNIFEPRGAIVQIARNGREALEALEKAKGNDDAKIDLVLMDVMMPEMDGITATREIRKQPDWRKLPIIMLTAKAMKDDQEKCLDAGANDYIAKPLDVEKLLSLARVWMPR
ncbi:MAG TPA: response regulator [Patescibacteria group bacterium]|nr:response regulator [Patescibacteria group bacterium]